MQFKTFVFAASAAIATLMTASPVAAIDYRVLATYSGYKTGVDFCNAWRCNCVNYVPKDKSLIFKGTYCNPGGFHGQNADTQAKVFCLFKNDHGTTPVNKHVAWATNATLS